MPPVLPAMAPASPAHTMQGQWKVSSPGRLPMSCQHEPGKTWRALIHAALEEDAARLALSAVQSRALLERLKRKNIFPNHKTKGVGAVSLSLEPGKHPEK